MTPGEGRGRPSVAAHVFVADLDVPTLEGDDRHHLARVLRLRPGEAVSVADGTGRWRLCTYTGDDLLTTAGPVVADPALSPEVTVGVALTKGEKPEWAVQKLTEIGVDRVLLFPSSRSVVAWDGDKFERNLDRLRRVARTAAMQSRRTRLPAVDACRGLGDALAACAAPALAHPAGAPLTLRTPEVLVGPEGGWSEEELNAAPATVDLGSTTLRAETAAVAAAVLLCALREDRVAPRFR